MPAVAIVLLTAIFLVESFNQGITIKETHKFEMLGYSFTWKGSLSVDDFLQV